MQGIGLQIGLEIAAEAVDQLGGFHGFAEVGVHAGGDAVLAVLGHDIGGEGNDGQALAVAAPALELADAAGGSEAVHDGHLAIHQDGVVVGLGNAFQGFGAVVGDGDEGRELLQGALGDALIYGVVFDQENVSAAEGGVDLRSRSGMGFVRRVAGEHLVSQGGEGGCAYGFEADGVGLVLPLAGVVFGAE